MVFASQIVHVTSEAKANPIMTAFTTISAFTNMPHGDRLRGSSTWSVAAKLAAGSCATPKAINAFTFRQRRIFVPIMA
jgi:hypothetical protein